MSLFTSHLLYGILLAQPEWMKTSSVQKLVAYILRFLPFLNFHLVLAPSSLFIVPTTFDAIPTGLFSA